MPQQPLPYQLRKFRPRGVSPSVFGSVTVTTPTIVGAPETVAANVSVDSSNGIPGSDVQEALQNLSDLIASLPAAPTVFL